MTEARDETTSRAAPKAAPRTAASPSSPSPTITTRKRLARADRGVPGRSAGASTPFAVAVGPTDVGRLALDSDVRSGPERSALRGRAVRRATAGRWRSSSSISPSMPHTAGPDGLAVRLTEVLGREARETDRAVRARLRAVPRPPPGDERGRGRPPRVAHRARVPPRSTTTITTGDIRIEIVVPRRGTDPSDAIAVADRRLAEPLATAERGARLVGAGLRRRRTDPPLNVSQSLGVPLS